MLYIITFICLIYTSANKNIKNLQQFIDNIFLNSIEFKSYIGNVTTKISDHIFQLLILWDFYQKTFVQVNEIFKRNYIFLNNDEI